MSRDTHSILGTVGWLISRVPIPSLARRLEAGIVRGARGVTRVESLDAEVARFGRGGLRGLWRLEVGGEGELCAKGFMG